MCLIIKIIVIYFSTPAKALSYLNKLVFHDNLLKDFLFSPQKNNSEKYRERAVSTFLFTVNNLNGFFYV